MNVRIRMMGHDGSVEKRAVNVQMEGFCVQE